MTSSASLSSAPRRRDFETLAMPLAPALYRTALRLGRSPDDARDVVQETFLRAYRTFDNFEAGTNGKAWLFTIMHSVVANRWRAERRAPDVVDIDDSDQGNGVPLISAWPDGEAQLLTRLGASAEVDTALRALPDAQRSVVLLVDVEELSYEEAAQVLDCPVGTVRSRLARGRRQLCADLSEYARRTGVLRERDS